MYIHVYKCTWADNASVHHLRGLLRAFSLFAHKQLFLANQSYRPAIKLDE